MQLVARSTSDITRAEKSSRDGGATFEAIADRQMELAISAGRLPEIPKADIFKHFNENETHADVACLIEAAGSQAAERLDQMRRSERQPALSADHTADAAPVPGGEPEDHESNR